MNPESCRGMTTIYVPMPLAQWLRGEAARRALSVAQYLSAVSAMPDELMPLTLRKGMGRPTRGRAAAWRAYLRDLVLIVLLDRGGAARTHEVLHEVHEIGEPFAPAELLRKHRTYRTWLELRTAFERKNLQSAGLLDRTEHGVWRLTPLGQDAAKRLKRLGGPKPPPKTA